MAIVVGDPTGTTLGGNFGLNVFLHGFNDSGKVLFRSNPGGGATSNHALFLKDLSSTAQEIFARNQAAPGGTTANSTISALRRRAFRSLTPPEPVSRQSFVAILESLRWWSRSSSGRRR